MLRAIILYLSRAEWARRLITSWGFARRTARRFVAGETLGEALQVARELNGRGILVSLDPLGENTTNPQEALDATEGILVILDRIQETGVQANVSIKLSQIGLALDEELCRANLKRILARAYDGDIFVRVDMEESRFTQQALDTYCAMRSLGFDNLGVVIQAYLYRSEKDIRHLMDLGTRVRLCKGAYKEPPELAFPQKKDVDENYDLLAALLLEGAKTAGAPLESLDGRTPPIPAIATHDPQRISFAREYARKIDLPVRAVEFQMLYGIRRDLQDVLAREGYPVRVYVPYGTQWYPYLMRRLGEHPANLWFFVSNFFRK